MRMILFSSRIVLGLLFVVSLFSCETIILRHKKKKNKKVRTEVVCNDGIILRNKLFSLKDKQILSIFKSIESIDLGVKLNKLKLTEKTINKFGSFTVYSDSVKSVKLISEVYVRNLKLASIKHEIYFLDDCNVIAKMTKFAYRSKRIKAIYYYSFHKEKYLGCIVEPIHTLFHKKDKWMDISDEKIAIDWSQRIYQNIVKHHLLKSEF
jgi:hypothetical protein